VCQHGADAHKKNRDGHTPLDLVKEGDTDVEDLLRGLLRLCHSCICLLADFSGEFLIV